MNSCKLKLFGVVSNFWSGTKSLESHGLNRGQSEDWEGQQQLGLGFIFLQTCQQVSSPPWPVCEPSVSPECRALRGGVSCGDDSAQDVIRRRLVPRKGQKTGSLRGLETACVTSPGEGSGKGDVGRGVFVLFFFFKGTSPSSEVFTFSSWCQQAGGRKIFSRQAERYKPGSRSSKTSAVVCFLNVEGKVRTQRRACSRKAFRRSLPQIRSFFSFS